MLELAEIGPGVECAIIKKKKKTFQADLEKSQPKRSGNQRSGPVPDTGDAELNLWCTMSVKTTLQDRIADPLKECTSPECMNISCLLFNNH